jgi:fibronectin type 3 domain-containing protein
MKIYFVNIALLLLLFATNVSAQQATASAGPNGVFIQFEKLLHGPQYVIERLLVGGSSTKPDWKAVCTTDKAPESAIDLIGRLTVLARKNSLYDIPDDSLTRILYSQYRNFSVVDSLGAFAFNPQYLEALGVGYLDTAVVQGKRYDYRIRQLTKAGNPVYHNPSTVSVPGSRLLTTADVVSHTANGTTVKIKYYLKKSRPDIAGAKVLRATYGQTDFQECGAQWDFRKGAKDSLFLHITDHNASRKMLYSYVVFVKDFLGNESNPSDTVTIASLHSQDGIPVINSIRTKSLEADDAIAISWQLSSVKDLRSVEIWRSEDYDRDYKMIGSAVPSDTVYLDQQVEPVKGYYYQVRLNGTYDQSPQSVKVSGMLLANREALIPPSNLSLTETSDSLFFRWQAGDFDTRGYYLYFSAGQSDSLRQYSDIILSTERDINFQVPIKNLVTGVGYKWAVAAVNTSYRISPMSESVYSQARYPERIATPLNPEMLHKEGHALLVWENMTEIDPFIQSYVIERKKENEKVFSILYSQTGDDNARNSYEDLTVTKGEKYLYRIQAIGIDGKRSAYSSESSYFDELLPVLPVRGLSVAVTNKGVRIAWDAPLTEAEKIVIYRYTEKTIAAKIIGSVTGQQTEFIDKYASPGISYYYSAVVVEADKRESEPTDMVGVQWK